MFLRSARYPQMPRFSFGPRGAGIRRRTGRQKIQGNQFVIFARIFVNVPPPSSLVNTLPITKKNKHTVVTEAPKKVPIC